MRKLEIIRSLEKAIMRPLSQLIHPHCNSSEKATAQYLVNLKSCGILPYEKSFEQHSPSSIINKALYFPKCQSEKCERYRCGCKAMSLRKEIRREVNNISNQNIGLCLDCVSTGRKSIAEGKCRILHVVEI